MSWWQSKEISQILACPICRADVQVDANDSGDGVVACLSGDCGMTFPVVAGVPRFLVGEARADFLRSTALPMVARHHFAAESEQLQKRTRTQYSRTWERIYHYKYSAPPFNSENPLDFGTFRKFLRDTTIHNSELVLDVGCGLGRFVACACHAAPKAIVVGLDLSSGVDFVYRTVRHLDKRYLQRCLAIQASIFAAPLKPSFDTVYSFGVLHHTPNPEKAFKECLRLAVKTGTTLAWLYGDAFKRRHPLLWHSIHFARQFHSKMHPELLWRLCCIYALSAPLLKWRYDFSVQDARYFWLDNLSNPFNFVFNREELLSWMAKANGFPNYEVEPLFGGWRIKASRGLE